MWEGKMKFLIIALKSTKFIMESTRNTCYCFSTSELSCQYKIDILLDEYEKKNLLKNVQYTQRYVIFL